ncbi:MAG: S8 family serine peptidase, partial [Cyanobacteria bacterium J06638_6]
GIMAAAGNNGVGMSGINWRSDVVNVDVFGPDAYDLDRATELMTDYAQETGRRLVVNMSLGAHGPGPGAMPGLERLIAQNQNNALFVISSGNADDGFNSYPANLSQVYDNVMAVGASWGTNDANGNSTAPGDRISYPGWWGSNYGYGLSLMGPSEVISTAAGRTSSGVGFGYYRNAPSGTPFNGTSAAAPNVSGVASLVWSANPNLSATQVHSILQQTAVDLGFPGYDLEYGAGMVNADAAVRRAMALAGTPLRGSSAETQGALTLPLVANEALAMALPITTATQAVESDLPAEVLASADVGLPNPFMTAGRVSEESRDAAEFVTFAATTALAPLDGGEAPAPTAAAELPLARMTEAGTPSFDALGAPQYDVPWELEALTQNLLAA